MIDKLVNCYWMESAIPLYFEERGLGGTERGEVMVRMYDPELGLFTSTDPAGQQWGPYTYVGNNPLSYVDPDGEIFVEAFLLAYKAYKAYTIANTAYQMYQGYQQGGIGGLVQSGLAYGSSYLIGSAVGGVANFGSSLGGTVLSGAVSGAVGGGAVSAMFGGSFGDGFTSGFVAGGISAGISYAGTHATLAVEADKLGLEGDPVEATDASLNKFSDDNFGDVKGLNSLEMAKKGNMRGLDGYYADSDGNIINHMKPAKKYDAITIGPKKPFIGSSDVRVGIRPFASDRRLYLVLGHEYVHVRDFYNGNAAKYYRQAPRGQKMSEMYRQMQINAYAWMQSYNF